MSFSSSSTKNIEIFFAYSQNKQDEKLRQALEEHLHELRSLGVYSKWHKYHIETEQDWEDEICEYLNKADLIILLVSSSFLNESCWYAPVIWAKERCEEKEVELIPVLLREVSGWEKVLEDLAPLPSNGKAIASSPNRDAAFVEVAQGIVEKVEELKQYQEKLQEYEQHFSEAIQREEPLSEYAREWLNNFKQTWNIKDRDTYRIEELVTQNQQELYQQNLQKYQESWYAATQNEYPISDSTRDELKSLQISLKLNDEDIARIEEQIPQPLKYMLSQAKPETLAVVFGGIIFSVFVFFGAMSSQIKSLSRQDFLISDQTKTLTQNSNDENFEGWIFIGKVKNQSYSSTVKKSLIGDSRTITSPVVPVKGNKVTAIKRLNLRQNRPQKPNFNPENSKLLGAIDKGEKIMILDTFIVPDTSTVWAKVRKL